MQINNINRKQIKQFILIHETRQNGKRRNPFGQMFYPQAEKCFIKMSKNIFGPQNIIYFTSNQEYEHMVQELNQVNIIQLQKLMKKQAQILIQLDFKSPQEKFVYQLSVNINQNQRYKTVQDQYQIYYFKNVEKYEIYEYQLYNLMAYTQKFNLNAICYLINHDYQFKYQLKIKCCTSQFLSVYELYLIDYFNALLFYLNQLMKNDYL
ncbi:hypothetical protein pb186bvf_001817 [Paramecium bursaria]